ncbi:DUF1330 domain-containing protein [Sphingomonas sp. 28-63-12]|uniref:DUF1330 domain-containing protein n=1 Tax=Sphingomonas sp. 28-63-12 TaxID=1970434 RepID=UPI000BC983E3|nr:MAG: DUF1330 domain-containing protein [Sphingomonas sp. 28-63-12]
MQVVNAILPTPAQVADFFGTAEDGPFTMVNLLKFKPRAAYADGRDPDLTGFEAYMRYGMAVQAHIKAVGGVPGYAGRVTGLMLGEVEELWDMVALAEYPSLAAFQQMVANPDYQAISVHREAGLAGQLNIKTQGPRA